MKDLYPIGAVSKLLGVSIKTLRYYDNEGILKPAFINEQTGYRYYTYSQFQMINRIRWLQNLGLRLFDIGEILKANNIDLLLNKLDNQLKIAEEASVAAQKKVADINWYIDYFSAVNQPEPLHIPYMRKYESRYILFTEIPAGSEASAFMQLNHLKNSPPYSELEYYLWYVYVMDFDYDALSRRPQYLGMLLKEPPSFYSPQILEMPAGNYLCFKCYYRQKTVDSSLFFNFFNREKTPKHILAFEYEQNLENFSNSLFDVQALFN